MAGRLDSAVIIPALIWGGRALFGICRKFLTLCTFGLFSLGAAAGPEIAEGWIVGFFDNLFEASKEGATSLLELVFGFLFNEGTTPQTDGPFLYKWAGLIFGLSLPIIVILMVFRIISSLFKSGEIAKTGAWHAVTDAGIAIIGAAISLPIVHLLTTLVDGITYYLAQYALEDGLSFSSAYSALIFGSAGLMMAGAIGMSGVGLMLIATGFMFIFLLSGGLIFLSLIVRDMLLYIVAVTAPLAISGLVFSPSGTDMGETIRSAGSRAWFTQWVRLILALIIAKLAIVMILGLGLSALSSVDWGSGLAQAIGAFLAGCLLMIIGGLMPLMAYRFFAFMTYDDEDRLNTADVQRNVGAGFLAGGAYSAWAIRRVRKASKANSATRRVRASSVRTSPPPPPPPPAPLLPPGPGGTPGPTTPKPLDSKLRRILDESVETRDGRVFYDVDDPMLPRSERVRGNPDVYAVHIHGHGSSVSFKGEELTPDELATVLENDDAWHGRPVWLVASSTGQADDGFAQQLADRLGVDVIAPTADVWVNAKAGVTVVEPPRAVKHGGTQTLWRRAQTSSASVQEPDTAARGQWRTFNPTP